MVKQSLEPQPKPAPAAPVEEASSSTSRTLDASKASGASMNNAMSDQIKSVQQMTGGSYDGQTYVLPTGKK